MLVETELLKGNRRLEAVFKELRKRRGYNFDYLERISYLTSLSLMVNQYKVEYEHSIFANSTFIEVLIERFKYNGLRLFRKFR
jgi:hypothetical protein